MTSIDYSEQHNIYGHHAIPPKRVDPVIYSKARHIPRLTMDMTVT